MIYVTSSIQWLYKHCTFRLRIRYRKIHNKLHSLSSQQLQKRSHHRPPRVHLEFAVQIPPDRYVWCVCVCVRLMVCRALCVILFIEAYTRRDNAVTIRDRTLVTACTAASDRKRLAIQCVYSTIYDGFSNTAPYTIIFHHSPRTCNAIYLIAIYRQAHNERWMRCGGLRAILANTKHRVDTSF